MTAWTFSTPEAAWAVLTVLTMPAWPQDEITTNPRSLTLKQVACSNQNWSGTIFPACSAGVKWEGLQPAPSRSPSSIWADGPTVSKLERAIAPVVNAWSPITIGCWAMTTFTLALSRSRRSTTPKVWRWLSGASGGSGHQR